MSGTGANHTAAMPIRADLRAAMDSMVRVRREFHQNPETGYREEWTSARVAEILRPDYPELRTGIAKTGVSALLRGSAGRGRAILLRSDMDALPLHEETTAPYASKNAGAMHACGHDGHMSILLHTARLAPAIRPAGDVRFVFQPAEEGPGGALPMIQEGIMKDPPIEAAFGLHLWSPAPVGKVLIRSGPMMAGPDEFELIINGRGGHAAYPHTAVDAVVVASHVVVALQTVVARSTDPVETAVVSVGMFQSGSNFNILAESARLRGTIRTFKPEVREVVVRRVREVADGICATFGATCTFHLIDHYPPLVNDPAMADFVAGIAAEVVGAGNVDRDFLSMGGEDMCYFLREAPGAFFFVGAGDADRGLSHAHHSPHFDFDENAMLIGAEIFLRILERYWTAFPQPPQKVAPAAWT
jgi:amidohydrolase